MAADRDEDAGSTVGWRETNRVMWDELAPIHAASDFYDLQGFRADRDVLRGFEHDEVGDVAGKSLLHLQCHIGTDTLSWAHRGARVTGLDFSAPAIKVARSLAADLGYADATFVESDVYAAPAALDRATYDVVYTGLGALCWLPDLAEWARMAASLVAPGGFLYLVEFHPVGRCVDSGSRWHGDYFDRGPVVDETSGSYADHAASTEHNVAVYWQHTLSDVISAVAGAGLRLEFLHEHEFTLFEHIDGMSRGTDSSGSTPGAGSVFRLPAGQPRVPLMYSLRAVKA